MAEKKTATARNVVIVGRDRICDEYGIGKETFYELIRIGAPIVKLANRHTAHRETLDDFVKELTLK